MLLSSIEEKEKKIKELQNQAEREKKEKLTQSLPDQQDLQVK